jgi:hypothetical protein
VRCCWLTPPPTPSFLLYLQANPTPAFARTDIKSSRHPLRVRTRVHVQAPFGVRITNLEADTAVSVRNLNAGFNVVAARMGAMEARMDAADASLANTIASLTESANFAYNVAGTTARLVNESALATARLDALNASSLVLLASGYQHTWDMRARLVLAESNNTNLMTRVGGAEGNIVSGWMCCGLRAFSSRAGPKGDGWASCRICAPMRGLETGVGASAGGMCSKLRICYSSIVQ